MIQGDREYCRLQQELEQANEPNDGNAIARIHEQFAQTIQSCAVSLLHGLGFSQEETTYTMKDFFKNAFLLLSGKIFTVIYSRIIIIYIFRY